jgi:membrane-associated phospholipid phosphatase
MIDEILRSLGWMGDGRLLLPLSAGLALALERRGASLVARRWLRVLVLGPLAMALIKTAGYALGLGSPSGHAFFAALFYGMLARLAQRWPAGWPRGFALAALGGLIVVVAANRLVTGVHTPGEVGLGLALGLGCLALLPGDCGTGAGGPSRRQSAACWSAVSLMLAAILGAELMDTNAETVLAALGTRLAGLLAG